MALETRTEIEERATSKGIAMGTAMSKLSDMLPTKASVTVLSSFSMVATVGQVRARTLEFLTNTNWEILERAFSLTAAVVSGLQINLRRAWAWLLVIGSKAAVAAEKVLMVGWVLPKLVSSSLLGGLVAAAVPVDMIKGNRRTGDKQENSVWVGGAEKLTWQQHSAVESVCCLEWIQIMCRLVVACDRL